MQNRLTFAIDVVDSGHPGSFPTAFQAGISESLDESAQESDDCGLKFLPTARVYGSSQIFGQTFVIGGCCQYVRMLYRVLLLLTAIHPL